MKIPPWLYNIESVNPSILGRDLENMYIFIETQLIKTGLVLWSLKGAPAVHFNLPVLSFYLYTIFKTEVVNGRSVINVGYHVLFHKLFGPFVSIRKHFCVF